MSSLSEMLMKNKKGICLVKSEFENEQCILSTDGTYGNMESIKSSIDELFESDELFDIDDVIEKVRESGYDCESLYFDEVIL